MEYTLHHPGSPYGYTILVTAGRWEGLVMEDYGVEVHDPSTGASACAPHLTPSIPRLDAFLTHLITHRIPPEGLAEAARSFFRKKDPTPQGVRSMVSR